MSWNFSVVIDVLTNFCCIVLINSFANKYYLWLCGCIDSKCRKQFFKLTTPKHPISNISTSMENTPTDDGNSDYRL